MFIEEEKLNSGEKEVEEALIRGSKDPEFVTVVKYGRGPCKIL